MSYIQGYLLAVPKDRKADYIRFSEASWPVFAENGCLSCTESWEEDVPEGETTSFPLAVKRQPGEAVVFSWMIWPDRATCDAAWGAVMNDPRLDALEMPFDGSRMMWGGFAPILERSA